MNVSLSPERELALPGRYRYCNALNDGHGFDDHYYQWITAPPPDGQKWDASRVNRLIEFAIPGLRIEHRAEDGLMEVHGFVETLGMSDGSLHVTLVIYDGDCDNVDCRFGHAGEVECEAEDCPKLPARTATELALAPLTDTSLFSPEELTKLAALAGLTGSVAPYKHTHKVVVRRRAVGQISPQQRARIGALLTIHPTYYLTDDEARNRQVYRALGCDPDDKDKRWEGLYSPGKGYNPPNAQHLSLAPPPESP